MSTRHVAGPVRAASALNPGRTPEPACLPRLWATLAAATGLLSLVGVVVALVVPDRVYAGETTLLADTATAQDLAGLAIAPALVVLAYFARRGHLHAWLVLVGVLSFTVYNYAIYAFSLSFGPLFLVWVATWWLSVFALVGAAASAPWRSANERCLGAGSRLPGWFLIAVATLIALLWLSEVVPDLFGARPSPSAATWPPPTHPVQGLDPGVYLSAAAASGVLLLRRPRFGAVSAVALLVFLALTCVPVLITPAVTLSRGHLTSWVVMVPIALVGVSTLLVLARILPALRPSQNRP